jgi:hypothetical protein
MWMTVLALRNAIAIMRTLPDPATDDDAGSASP